MILGGKDTTFFTYGNRMCKKKVGLSYYDSPTIFTESKEPITRKRE